MIRYRRSLNHKLCRPRIRGGNVMEAINIGLTISESKKIENYIGNTGSLMIVISPGSGIYKTTSLLLENTKEMIIEQNTSVDLVCLTEEPLHKTPLAELRDKQEDNRKFYKHIYWMYVFHYSIQYMEKNFWYEEESIPRSHQIICKSPGLRAPKRRDVVTAKCLSPFVPQDTDIYNYDWSVPTSENDIFTFELMGDSLDSPRSPRRRFTKEPERVPPQLNPKSSNPFKEKEEQKKFSLYK
eukprot:TRINITY_DN6512_c0_g1_i2.p1 TRINITY_DN6512_c0_g1~~TRINITY_DN6512_c0_g1_i2.p1  ORF type:complete len:240 (+),score=38.86 TRINITY_DN6512_c0_g1_i2:92-811(+)